MYKPQPSCRSRPKVSQTKRNSEICVQLKLISRLSEIFPEMGTRTREQILFEDCAINKLGISVDTKKKGRRNTESRVEAEGKGGKREYFIISEFTYCP